MKVLASICLWELSVGGIRLGQQIGLLDVKVVWYQLALGYGVAWLLLRWRFKRKISLG